MSEQESCQPTACRPSFWQQIRWKVPNFRQWFIWLVQTFAMWIIKSTVNSKGVQHAERELRLAGFYDKDSDYGGMLAGAVMELMCVFSMQGHSGFSAHQTIHLFTKVAKFENLSPLTSNPDEWNDVSYVGESCWQNKRDSRCFSKDGGMTWYNIEDCMWIFKSQSGSTWQTRSRGNEPPEIEEGEEFVREPQCHMCMVKNSCDHAYTLNYEN